MVYLICCNMAVQFIYRTKYHILLNCISDYFRPPYRDLFLFRIIYCFMRFVNIKCEKVLHMIYIYIEIQKLNRFKDLLHKIHSKLKDLLFSILQHTPDRFIPKSLMRWFEKYTNALSYIDNHNNKKK